MIDDEMIFCEKLMKSYIRICHSSKKRTKYFCIVIIYYTFDYV
jgi:hypothetical protein